MLFFFSSRRRHTRWPRDWSSDVCSSDLTRIVGVTLLLLGVYVFASLIRHGRDFRLRSRWMLVFAGARRAARWVRRRAAERANGTEQRRAGDVTVAEEVEAPSWHHSLHTRPSPHPPT